MGSQGHTQLDNTGYKLIIHQSRSIISILTHKMLYKQYQQPLSSDSPLKYFTQDNPTVKNRELPTSP